MKIDFEGRAVLVTGGGRGIGAAISRAFAEANARVLIHYGHDREAAEAMAAEIGGGAAALQADLADPWAAVSLWRRAEEIAAVAVLVNNAGAAASSPLEGDAGGFLKAWEATMAVNATSPAMLCREAVASFRGRGGGRIVNITSRAAHRGDAPDYLAYAASKAALGSLTKTIARGFRKEGVRAFSVAPGFTRTAMAQDFIDRYGEEHASGDIALTKLTAPRDVAPTVVFLASGLADHATGSTIDVNAASYVR